MAHPRQADATPVSELFAAPRARAGPGARTASAPVDGQGYLHDIRHQIATLMMLVAAMEVATGSEDARRALADHLLTESRRLDDLLAAMARHPSTVGAAPDAEPGTEPDTGPPATVRLDELVCGLTAPFRALDGPALDVLVTAVVVRHDPLALWRAVRNILDNARTAAGPAGHVAVRVFDRDGFAIVDVDDDGPGLPAGPARRGGRGLTIAGALARGWGGRLELASSRLGGCKARLVVPLWLDGAGGS